MTPVPASPLRVLLFSIRGSWRVKTYPKSLVAMDGLHSGSGIGVVREGQSKNEEFVSGLNKLLIRCIYYTYSSHRVGSLAATPFSQNAILRDLIVERCLSKQCEEFYELPCDRSCSDCR
jgi:hypothetical protein